MIWHSLVEISLWAFSRKPTKDGLSAALDHIEKMDKKYKTAGKKTADENIIWASLLNNPVETGLYENRI